jgi:regulator of sigma E protease
MLSQPPIWLIFIAFICAIGPLVFIHELGHYLVARWFGVGAEVFSIGFGREIFGWKDKRGTRWKVGWLPLGGYVRFAGDADIASAASSSTPGSSDVTGHAFHDRPVGQRFLIVLAGPMANFLIAILIFAAFFATIGMPRTPNVIDSVVPQGAASTAGLKPGDRIVSVAGRRTATFEDITRIVVLRPGEQVEIKAERSGRPLIVNARLGVENEVDRFGQQYRVGRLGIITTSINYERVGIVELVPVSAGFTLSVTRAMIDGLWQIISGRRSVKELGGPLKLAQIAGQQASLGLFQFIQLVALFSINLGFINLLPVPMLDGGHLAFYAVEAARRRPVGERAQEWAFRGGLAALLALLVFVTINDLSSFGLWERLGRLIG